MNLASPLYVFNVAFSVFDVCKNVRYNKSNERG